jgi:2-(1,2-epoxy-1,2-dihydrophenyl)acetyl-CoA isomerase
MAQYEQILWERRGDVGLLTLNRPDKLNAWTRHMQAEMFDALDRANADPAIGAVVVTGAGRGFCAGADVKAQFATRLEGGPRPAEPPREESRRDWVAFVRESKPLLAAINGVAVGVGLTMVLPFDVLLASSEARVGMFFVRMGLVPELASSHFLAQRVGFGLASEMCLTGQLYPASELAGSGLFNRVVAPDRLLDEALALAAAIAANPDWSLRTIKRLLTENATESDPTTVQRREMAALEEAYRTPEHREAVAAFLEKRPASFRRSA